MYTGNIKTIFYDDSQYNPGKIYCHGKITTKINQNEEKEFSFGFIFNNNAFLVRDIVSFEIDKNGKAESVLFKDPPIIELDNDEVITKIKEANDYLSIIQMRNPNIEDKKGYDNGKFNLGLKLNEMWGNYSFVADNKNLLLQVTASLLVGHIGQSKKISTLLNEKYFNDILPYYKILKDKKVLSSIRRRSKTLESNFVNYNKTIKEFYCNYIEDDDGKSSLVIYSYNKGHITKLIQDCEFLTFSNKTDLQTDHHCYLTEKTVGNKKLHIIDINDVVINNNPLFRNILGGLKDFFATEQQFTILNSKINTNDIVNKDKLIRSKKYGKI